jgi:hypothetical protein
MVMDIKLSYNYLFSGLSFLEVSQRIQEAIEDTPSAITPFRRSSVMK